jgi:hypothetical protein
MGITKASLATESWLSAASFQETTRLVLTRDAGNTRDPRPLGLTLCFGSEGERDHRRALQADPGTWYRPAEQDGADTPGCPRDSRDGRQTGRPSRVTGAGADAPT